MGDWAQLATIFRSTTGIKLGPGVLSTIGMVAVVAFLALAVIAWALSGVPWLAVIALFLVGGIAVYAIERAFRYAERNPLTALMGGGELLKLIEHQLAAKDKTLVGDETPVVGAPKAIEAQKDGE